MLGVAHAVCAVVLCCVLSGCAAMNSVAAKGMTPREKMGVIHAGRALAMLPRQPVEKLMVV